MPRLRTFSKAGLVNRECEPDSLVQELPAVLKMILVEPGLRGARSGREKGKERLSKRNKEGNGNKVKYWGSKKSKVMAKVIGNWKWYANWSYCYLMCPLNNPGGESQHRGMMRGPEQQARRYEGHWPQGKGRQEGGKASTRVRTGTPLGGINSRTQSPRGHDAATLRPNGPGPEASPRSESPAATRGDSPTWFGSSPTNKDHDTSRSHFTPRLQNKRKTVDDVMSCHLMRPTEVCDWITQEKSVLYLRPPAVETQWHIFSSSCVRTGWKTCKASFFSQLWQHKRKESPPNKTQWRKHTRLVDPP